MVTLGAALGPVLLGLSVKVMVSPTLGAALFTVLTTTRSACCGEAGALAVLLLISGSNWSSWLMVAVLTAGLGLLTRASTIKVRANAVSTLPSVHRPLPLL